MKRTVSRVGAGILDQGVSSLSNVLASIAVARSVTPTAFGAFALAYSVYILILGISRGLSGETYILIGIAKPDSSPVEADAIRYKEVDRRGMIYGAGAMGIAAGIALILGSLFMKGALFTSFLIVGVSMPILLMQDAGRFCAIGEHKPLFALISDSLWCLLVIVGAIIGGMLAIHSLAFFVGLWALAGIISGLLLLIIVRAKPSLKLIPPWFRSTHHIGTRLGAEYLVSIGVRQVGLTIVGIVIGLDAVGAIRGGQAILGPVTTFQYALLVILVPEIRRYSGSSERQRRIARLATVLLSITEAVFGGVLWLMPSSVGRALLGDTWPAVHAILIPQIAIVMAVGVLLGGELLLRGNTQVNRALKLRVISGCGTMLGTIIGCVAGSLQLALWLQAAAPASMVVPYWRAGRETSEESSPNVQPKIAPVDSAI